MSQKVTNDFFESFISKKSITKVEEEQMLDKANIYKKHIEENFGYNVRFVLQGSFASGTIVRKKTDDPIDLDIAVIILSCKEGNKLADAKQKLFECVDSKSMVSVSNQKNNVCILYANECNLDFSIKYLKDDNKYYMQITNGEVVVMSPEEVANKFDSISKSKKELIKVLKALSLYRIDIRAIQLNIFMYNYPSFSDNLYSLILELDEYIKMKSDDELNEMFKIVTEAGTFDYSTVNGKELSLSSFKKVIEKLSEIINENDEEKIINQLNDYCKHNFVLKKEVYIPKEHGRGMYCDENA